MPGAAKTAGPQTNITTAHHRETVRAARPHWAENIESVADNPQVMVFIGQQRLDNFTQLAKRTSPQAPSPH
jgi:hypothetical protein